MKTLILQVDIGSGSQWGSDQSKNVIHQFCIPSVKKYASRNRYDYKVLTRSTYTKRIGSLDFLMTEVKHYAFERYLHLDTDYERLVYIDNDVYIPSCANRLPHVNGLMACKEPDGTSSHQLFCDVNQLPLSTPYYNSGVIMADKKSAKELGKYMIYRARNHIHAKGKSTDNMMFNEYLIEKRPKFTALGEEWNYMPVVTGATLGLKSNFMHLVGNVGKEIIDHFIISGNEINQTLDDLATGKLKLSVKPT